MSVSSDIFVLLRKSSCVGVTAAGCPTRTPSLFLHTPDFCADVLRDVVCVSETCASVHVTRRQRPCAWEGGVDECSLSEDLVIVIEITWELVG